MEKLQMPCAMQGKMKGNLTVEHKNSTVNASWVVVEKKHEVSFHMTYQEFKPSSAPSWSSHATCEVSGVKVWLNSGQTEGFDGKCLHSVVLVFTLPKPVGSLEETLEFKTQQQHAKKGINFFVKAKEVALLSALTQMVGAINKDTLPKQKVLDIIDSALKEIAAAASIVKE